MCSRDELEIRVKERTAELSELISDLLRLARAREEAMREEQVGPVQAADILQSVVQLIKAEANSKDLFLSVEVFNLLDINNTIDFTWVQDVGGRYYAIPDFLTPRRLNVKLVARF